ncbi:hypothetical protein ACFL6O_00170 [candidate division KSB1 bacterium]
MENKLSEESRAVEIEESPPVLSSWNKLYSVVFINLICLILLFFFFTKYFD